VYINYLNDDNFIKIIESDKYECVIDSFTNEYHIIRNSKPMVGKSARFTFLVISSGSSLSILGRNLF